MKFGTKSVLSRLASSFSSCWAKYQDISMYVPSAKAHRVYSSLGAIFKHEAAPFAWSDEIKSAMQRHCISCSFKGTGHFGNCQRPVFSLGVSQHMHKITNLWKFDSIGHRSCKRIMKEKTPLLHKFVCFQMLIKASGLKSFIIWVRNYLFLKNYVTSEGAVSHNVLYYQQLSIARYQVSFYANNYFE